MRSTRRRRVLSVGKWMGLVACATIGIVAAVRLGHENYWFAPVVLALTALCMGIIVKIVAKSPLPSRRTR